MDSSGEACGQAERLGRMSSARGRWRGYRGQSSCNRAGRGSHEGGPHQSAGSRSSRGAAPAESPRRMAAARRRQLEADIVEQAASLRRLSASLERQRREAARQANPPRTRACAFVRLRLAMDLAGGDEERALVLARWRQERSGSARAKLVLGHGPEPYPWKTLAMDEAARLARAEAEQPQVLHRAALMVAEARVVRRIAQANSRGASPTARDVAAWLSAAWPGGERRGRSAAFLRRLSQDRYRAKALWRFRRLWRVRLRIMPWRSALEPAVASQKVFRGNAGIGSIFRAGQIGWGRSGPQK